MGETVTVASKLPMNLVLHLEEPFEQKEATPMGHLNVTRHRRLEHTVMINGMSQHVGEAASVPLQNGFALTHGVDKDFWDKWLSAHLDYAPIVSGMLYAVPKKQDAKVETKSRASIKSGFEAADPASLPKEFTTGNLKITGAREKKE